MQKKRGSKTESGESLKDKMIESEKYGDQYRESHQGEDALEKTVLHNNRSTQKDIDKKNGDLRVVRP